MIQEKFCLYEVSKDEWLSKNNNWISHKIKLYHDIPDSYELLSGDGENQVDMKVVPSGNSVQIEVPDYTSQVYVDELMLFDSFKEAEEYIHQNPHLIHFNYFVSVRKIYFQG